MRQHLLRALVLLALPASLYGQTALGIFDGNEPQAKAPQAAGAATLRGRILAADTGRPLRGARVQIAGLELTAARGTLTDLSGAYEFANLPAGRYTLSASMASFIGLSYGQTRPFEAGKPIAVADKQQLSGIDLRLPRGGAIEGVVLDDVGQPLINANVRVWRPQFVRGVRRLQSVATGRSNDIGEFRLYGLQPGRYVVSASKGFLVSVDAAIKTETGFAPTFFPGTRSEASASLVDVKLGQTTGGVRFALDPSQVGSIAGAVFFPDGRPATFGAALPTIRPFGRPDGFIPTTSMSGDGMRSNFRAAALAPGEYDVHAVTMSAAASTPPQGVFSRVTLNGENIKDIRLVLQPLPSATGRIVLDAGITGTIPLAAIKLGTESLDPWADANPTSVSSSPAADATFTLYTPPGMMRIKPVLPRGWSLKAVRVNDRDVTDAGIEFKSGEAVSDVEVVITNRPTQVSGAAKAASGENADDYAVILFPRDRDRRDGDSRHFATTRADLQGTFQVTGLAAGDYYAIALDYLDPADAQDPALLDRLEHLATPFTLQDRERKELELKVVKP